MRLLIKFPTRQRPQKFLKTFRLYVQMLAWPRQVSFLITCDTDDPTMNNPGMRKKILAAVPAPFRSQIQIIYGKSKSKIDAINRDMRLAPDNWDVLLLASDDMIPQVIGYDRVILSQMRKSYPDTDGVLFYDDGYAHDRLNTLVICGRAYYNRFHYIYYPAYRSFFCDNEFMDVANLLNKQSYFPKVLIKHEHPVWNERVGGDPLYTKNDQHYRHDEKIFRARRSRFYGLLVLPRKPRRKPTCSRIHK